ncbi:MAG TPA: hypothetical protein VEC56_00635 [Candidatus Krumholzibacteria bacterium]|nr:hypothetical protein [Candidatus Krumholzibacteria bacterium]
MSKNRSHVVVGSIVLAITGILAFMGGVLPVSAQTPKPKWTATDWKEIDDPYKGGQRALAIQRLEEKLATKGNRYSDEILDGILPMLKDYFVEFEDAKRFQAIIERTLRQDKQGKVVDYFQGTSLYATANKAREEWSKPREAEAKLTKSTLAVGDTTTYEITVLNKSGDRLSTEGMQVRATPAAKASVNKSTRQITALAPGRVNVTVVTAEGRQVGGMKVIEVVEAPPVRVEIVPQASELIVGESTTFIVNLFDKENKPMTGGPAVNVDLFPTGLATLDKAKQEISAVNAGTVTLRALDKDDNVLGETAIRIKNATVTIDPILQTLKVGESASFVVRTTRSFESQNLHLVMEPPGIASYTETSSQLEKQVQVTATKVGTARLLVKNSNGATVAEAAVEVTTGPTAAAAADSGPSAIPMVVGAGVTAGLFVMAAVEEENNYLYAGIATAAITGYFAYKYFTGKKKQQALNAQQDGLRLSAGVSHVAITYNF